MTQTMSKICSFVALLLLVVTTSGGVSHSHDTRCIIDAEISQSSHDENLVPLDSTSVEANAVATKAAALQDMQLSTAPIRSTPYARNGKHSYRDLYSGVSPPYVRA